MATKPNAVQTDAVWLTADPAEELTRRLALAWTLACLPSPQPYRYLDYVIIVENLLLDVGDLYRTERIVMAVLLQAATLAKTSTWVERELRVEAMMSLASMDRIEYLRIDLRGADSIDDTILDQYNERLTRFSSYGQ